jgi:hypothetical protein
MDTTGERTGNTFSIVNALALFVLAGVFNYLAIVLSSIMHGDTAPAAFSYVSVMGGNMLFFGLPYSLSLLYLASCSWVMHRFFPLYVGNSSAIFSHTAVLLVALASYGILSLPFLVWSSGTHGLGMMAIMLIRSIVL